MPRNPTASQVSVLSGPPKNLKQRIAAAKRAERLHNISPPGLPSVGGDIFASPTENQDTYVLAPTTGSPNYTSFADLLSPTADIDTAEPAILDALGTPVSSVKPVKERVLPPPFISKLKKIDPVTRKWLRNATDERAASESRPKEDIIPMLFNPARGEYAVKWVQDNIRIYEDPFAGEPFQFMDWQYDLFMRAFSWIRWHPERKCWVRRFRFISSWYPKKTGKSPTLPAIGHFLFAGEGVRGNKCYSIAYDTKQASISQDHAVAMVEMAKEQGTQFGLDCTVSYTTKTITHRPTRSKYLMASGDKQDMGGKAKEGYNGSLLIDETHVMNERYIRRLERAGISRKEPFMVEMSTAGLEKDGYGFSRYNYGLKVHNSNCIDKNQDVYDPSLLFVEYSAPQNLTVEDLQDEKRIDGWIRQANPSIGHILTFTQAKEEWAIEKGRGPEALRDFGVYRLNIWMDSTESWINMTDWRACTFPYTFEDIKDFPCVIGLDLSKTRDMSSANIQFAVPEKEMRNIIEKNGGNPNLLVEQPPMDLPKSIAKWMEVKTYKPGKRVFSCQWPLYWLPESAIARYAHGINFRKWEEQIEFTKSEVIDYDTLCKVLDWCKKNLNLLGIAYDAYEAAKVVSILVEQKHWNPEFFLIVKQNMYSMGPLTLDYERGIIGHEILNPDCPVLNWQANHVNIVRDKFSDMRRPVKPEGKDSYKKVDGIVAGIICRAAWNTHEKQLTGSKNTSFLLFPAGTQNPYRRNEHLESVAKKGSRSLR